MYDNRYGFDKIERARRLVNNIPPRGIPVPKIQKKRLKLGSCALTDDEGFTKLVRCYAHFTDKYRYIEDLYQLDMEDMKLRNFISVRSQKFGELKNKNKYYKVYLKYSIYKTFYTKGFDIVGCNCLDFMSRGNTCKHMMAVKWKYKNSILKKLIF
mgnify:FL=1|tara:strand:- start:123 stop:587 length:465 start_codon:yes stop_codon:yes gene_type:complete